MNKSFGKLTGVNGVGGVNGVPVFGVISWLEFWDVVNRSFKK